MVILDKITRFINVSMKCLYFLYIYQLFVFMFTSRSYK